MRSPWRNWRCWGHSCSWWGVTRATLRQKASETYYPAVSKRHLRERMGESYEICMQQREKGCEGNPFSTLLKCPQDTVFKELSHVSRSRTL